MFEPHAFEKSEMMPTPNCQEEDLYLRHLLYALYQVDKDYYNYIPLDSEKKKVKKREEHLERVFAYELYHQWSKVIEDNLKVSDLYRIGKNRLYINGEISKNFLQEEPSKSNATKYPDMILHGGQDEGLHNEIVIEIKRWCYVKAQTNDELVTDDLKKLCECMIPGKLYSGDVKKVTPYKKGVFILTYSAESSSTNENKEKEKEREEAIGKLKRCIQNVQSWLTEKQNDTSNIPKNLYLILCSHQNVEYFTMEKPDEIKKYLPDTESLLCNPQKKKQTETQDI